MRYKVLKMEKNKKHKISVTETFVNKVSVKINIKTLVHMFSFLSF